MTDIRVPTLGESVTEATIGKWFKQPGEAVAVDEPLVELETDKVTIEVPSPAAGVLSDIAAKDGETVAVGALLGRIQEGAAGAAKPAAAKTGSKPTGKPEQKSDTTAPIGAGPEEVQQKAVPSHDTSPSSRKPRRPTRRCPRRCARWRRRAARTHRPSRVPARTAASPRAT